MFVAIFLCNVEVIYAEGERVIVIDKFRFS